MLFLTYYAGPSLGNPLGILFDPRKDEKTFVADQWSRVEDYEILKNAKPIPAYCGLLVSDGMGQLRAVLPLEGK